MRLNENWRRILGKSWSLRLVALIGVLQVLDAILPLLGASIPPGAMTVLSILAALGAAAARVIAQPDIERRKMPRDASSQKMGQ